jgi:hypothetical protein
MSGLKRLWTNLKQFAEAFEDIEDPKGNYIRSLGTRVDKLERDVQHLERQLQPRDAPPRTSQQTRLADFRKGSFPTDPTSFDCRFMSASPRKRTWE